MSKSLMRFTSVIFIALFLCIFDFSLQPSKVEAQVFKDPLLEYSYHFKIDLTWLKQFVNRAFDITGMNESQASRIQKILGHVEKIGVFDLENMTGDMRLEGDRFTGSAKILVKPGATETSLLREIISTPPRASVIRALIPEDQILAWISVMDPLPLLDTLDEYIFQPVESENATEKNPLMKKSNPLRNGPFAELLNECGEFIGNEAHLVLYDLGGFDDINPKPYAALIIEMNEGVKEEDLKIIKDAFKSMFVDNLGGKMETGNWINRFEVLSFKEFGCPLEITPSLIVDKNFLIFATHPEILYKTAEFVLTPARTAQAMPVVMNAMITVKVNKLIEILPPDFWEFLELTPIGSEAQLKNLTNAIKEEDWGTIQFMRTHLPDGMLLECSMDRSLFSLLFTIWQELIISNIRTASRMEAEEESKSDLHTIQIALERYAVDNEGKYPKTSEELINLDYITEFPVNTFSEEPMKDVSFNQRAPGEFTYISIADPESGLINNFVLLGYGETENKYDKLNNEALSKEGVIEENPDGVQDDVLLIITSG